MPPGPKGYPMLGNVMQVNFHNIVESLTKWTEEFGDIFKINLIGQDIVVVSNFKLFTVHIFSTKGSDMVDQFDFFSRLGNKLQLDKTDLQIIIWIW